MLIDAAAELCIRQGFERTTVDEIAAIVDVSPRTFSRYFSTKDAVIMALVDEVGQIIGEELIHQPADISPLEAVYRANRAMYQRTRTAGLDAMNPERFMATTRIIMTSPALRQAISESRAQGTHEAIASRIGVEPDDRRVKLVVATWLMIIMTALGDLGSDTDWDRLNIEDVMRRIEDTYAEFLDMMADIRQQV